MAERSIWNGTVTFGLVSIPVSLHVATEAKSIYFNQIHAKCKTKIQEKRWCPTCEREVGWDEIEKGYQYAKGKYIAISKEDLDSLPLPSKQIIAVQSFVKLEEIDPVYFEKTYYLEPEAKVEKPFALFMHTLIDKGVVGIGTFAIRSKERLCCLRPAGGILMLDTLLYPDEIKIDLNKALPHSKLAPQEVKMAANLVDMMMEPFDPQHFKDHYREELQKLIDAKLEGEPIAKESKSAKGAKLYDLMDALRRSIDVEKKGKVSKSKEKKKVKKPHLVSISGGKTRKRSRKIKVAR